MFLLQWKVLHPQLKIIIDMNKKITYEDKIFIAGSKGMVGSAIKRKLIEKGYGDLKKGGNIFTPPRQELDLVDQLAVENWFKKNKPTVVILAAAKVGGILANSKYPVDFLLTNLKIQTNVIESAWHHKVKRFLFLGSSCIYPKFAKQPIKEEYLLESNLEKTNESYAIAKISGLKLCEAFREQYGFDAISLMPTNLYGPGDNYHPKNSHVMASLIRKFYNAEKESLKEVICWGSGNPKREFLHVDDLGDASVFCLENWDTNSKKAPLDIEGKPINHLNVGTGEDISIKELAYLISDFTDFKGQIIWDKNRPDGTPRKQLDISKIKSLGWAPKISLKKGIENTLKYCSDEFLNKSIN